MSRHFKKDEFDMIYKIYNQFGLKKNNKLYKWYFTRYKFYN